MAVTLTQPAGGWTRTPANFLRNLRIATAAYAGRMGEQENWRDPERIRMLLDDTETWAVVGLSGDPTREAYGVARELQRHGKRIVPVHPSAPTVHGEQGYATLAEVPFDIDVVDVFRRSDAAGEFSDQAVAVGAHGVWFQLGVIDTDAYARTSAAGVPMVMDACPVIEWRRRR